MRRARRSPSAGYEEDGVNYRIKLALFRLIERMPHGDAAYYFLQRHVTKSLVIDKATFLDCYASKVRQHLEAFKEYGATPLSESVCYEFGAGWDLISAIGFSLNGMRRYICVDINRLLHVREIFETLRHYADCAAELGVEAPRLPAKPLTTENAEAYLRDCLRIDYLAPYDARKTDLASDSVGYIVSNVTLEHIPKDDIRAIMAECFRILKRGGLVSVTVDHSDHWAHADASISAYHYLQFSEDEWKRYNPSMHYQNRLRCSDYQKIFDDCGFETVDAQWCDAPDKDLRALANMRVADCFAGYSESDLRTASSRYILKKSETPLP